jgi:hypothetical protein
MWFDVKPAEYYSRDWPVVWFSAATTGLSYATAPGQQTRACHVLHRVLRSPLRDRRHQPNVDESVLAVACVAGLEDRVTKS